MLNHHSAGALSGDLPYLPVDPNHALSTDPLSTQPHHIQTTAARSSDQAVVMDKPNTDGHSLSGDGVKYEPKEPIVPTDKPNTDGHSLNGGGVKYEPKEPIVPPGHSPNPNGNGNPTDHGNPTDNGGSNSNGSPGDNGTPNGNGNPTGNDDNSTPPDTNTLPKPNDQIPPKAEILWRHTSLGISTTWHIENGSHLVGAQNLVYGASVGDDRVGTEVKWDSSWKLSGAADFNGDGITDHVYDNGVDILVTTLGQVNGQTATLESAIAPILNGKAAVIPTGWDLIGATDMNGDGIGDLLFHSATEDATAVWQLDAQHNVTQTAFIRYASGDIAYTTPTGQASPWKVDGWGDFNGDGQIDLLYRWAEADQTAIWLLDGTTVKAAKFVNFDADTGYKLAVGDFNGDGIDDIVARNAATDTTKIWLFDGQGEATETVLASADIGWQVKAIADMDGDNTDDLIWHHQELDLTAIWTMKNGSTSSAQWVQDYRTGGDQSQVKTGDAGWNLELAIDLPKLTAA